MSDSIYAPPTAKLNAEPADVPAFFTVSPTKLMTMLLATSGLYGVYWFYKNWALYKQYSGRSIWPVPRAWFGLFFLPSLFCKLDRTLKEQGKGAMPYWKTSAALYILIALAPLVIGLLTSMFQALSGMAPAETSIGPMIVVATVPLVLEGLILLRVQAFINVLNGDPAGSTNAGITNWNWLWILIGALYWIGSYYWFVGMIQTPA